MGWKPGSVGKPEHTGIQTFDVDEENGSRAFPLHFRCQQRVSYSENDYFWKWNHTKYMESNKLLFNKHKL